MQSEYKSNWWFFWEIHDLKQWFLINILWIQIEKYYLKKYSNIRN